MNKIELTDEYLEKIEAQFKLWVAFLNTGIGLLAFTLGLASLGTNSPSINASLSVFIICLVRINGHHFFPEEIRKLRKQAQQDSKAQIILDGFDKKHFGFKTNFTKYNLFTFGFIFLILVASSPLIIKFVPTWGVYVGI